MTVADRFAARLGLDTASLASLAAVWPVLPDRLAAAVDDAAGIALDDVQRLDFAVLVDEVLAAYARHDELSSPATTDLLLDALIAAPAGRLHVADRLAGRLDLLELAEDLAGGQPRGRLTVEAVPPAAIAPPVGLFSRSRHGSVVLLADNLSGDALTEVFAHEIAHALDPAFAGMCSDGSEAFAETLGPLLVEHRPTSGAEAAPLVAEALAATTRRRHAGPSRWTIDALLGWALAEVLDTPGELELAAARFPRVGASTGSGPPLLSGGVRAEGPASTGVVSSDPGRTCAPTFSP